VLLQWSPGCWFGGGGGANVEGVVGSKAGVDPITPLVVIDPGRPLAQEVFTVCDATLCNVDLKS
jgi:hypothetical protein